MRSLMRCITLFVLLLWSASLTLGVGLQAQEPLDCEDPFIPDATPAYYLGQGAVLIEQGQVARAVEAYSWMDVGARRADHLVRHLGRAD